MALICKRCTARCTKKARKFCTRKTVKKRKMRPEKPKKGETGCVLGAGGDGGGWGRVRADSPTGEKQAPGLVVPQQQKDLPAFLTKRCWLELPLKGAPSRRSSLETCQRHVFLTLGPSRVQVLPRSNEKKSGIAEAIPDFFGRGRRTCLGCRLGRRWTVATGDRRPSARGFGVDVGKRRG